jgi:hypothetical protein
MSLRLRLRRSPRVHRLGTACSAALAAAWLALSPAPARAEVPAAPEQHGREFRVDFSARHLDVDAELGELSLSGHVEVTVGRYRLGGERVRLKRGPRGISVQGGGDIAFCRCENPPVTLGYSSVTIAPPSDVIIEHAVLRAGRVPLFWLPYLWLRSPDRLGLIFPSVEWRGDDGLLVGSGVHVPFSANQGRPSPRAFDLAGYGYTAGGARIDARLLSPQSTTFVRWEHLRDRALVGVDAHASVEGESGARIGYDIDVSRGARGRSGVSSLEAAARRYDHARFALGSSGSTTFALGAQADAPRGDWLDDPISLGPFASVATGGGLGKATSYGLELGAGSWLETGERRSAGGVMRGVQRGTLESSLLVGPALLRLGTFEQSDWLALPTQAALDFRAGAGARLSLPLLRLFSTLAHAVEPSATARFERRYWDTEAQSFLLATGGLDSSLGTGPRGGSASARLGAGVAGEPASLVPVTEAALSSDTRLFGLRVQGLAEPRSRAAEATGRLRLGSRGGTNLVGFAEARTEVAPAVAPAQAGGDVLPRFQELGSYDASGLTTGGELTFNWWSVLMVGGGADVAALEQELLAVRGFARYRHACGCVAISGFASQRTGRAGFDAGLSLDLMP